MPVNFLGGAHGRPQPWGQQRALPGFASQPGHQGYGQPSTQPWQPPAMGRGVMPPSYGQPPPMGQPATPRPPWQPPLTTHPMPEISTPTPLPVQPMPGPSLGVMPPSYGQPQPLPGGVSTHVMPEMPQGDPVEDERWEQLRRQTQQGPHTMGAFS